MNAAALLAELDAVGVRLSLAGDDLHYQTRPGVRIAPYRERIQESKPAILRELLQREIVATVDVEPEHFDRQKYDTLWARYDAQLPADLAASLRQLAAKVRLEAYRKHPRGSSGPRRPKGHLPLAEIQEHVATARVLADYKQQRRQQAP